MKKILGVGIATLDIINEVDHYPHEDEEMRAVSQRIATGGNATNTLTVLAQAGYTCDFHGVLAGDNEGMRITQMMQAQGIDVSRAELVDDGVSPVSYITLNQQSGSRTIVHHRDLPELSAGHFLKYGVDDYAWLHFEGRNIAETLTMLEACREYRYKISIELEKPRDNEQRLIPYANTVMFSQTYMVAMDERNPEIFLRKMQAKFPGVNMTCTMGKQGAYAMSKEGEKFVAFADDVQAFDTIGAGDTFNAGLIDGLCQEEGLNDALHRATSLATRKVAQEGLLSLFV